MSVTTTTLTPVLIREITAARAAENELAANALATLMGGDTGANKERIAKMLRYSPHTERRTLARITDAVRAGVAPEAFDDMDTWIDLDLAIVEKEATL